MEEVLPLNLLYIDIYVKYTKVSFIILNNKTFCLTQYDSFFGELLKRQSGLFMFHIGNLGFVGKFNDHSVIAGTFS